MPHFFFSYSHRDKLDARLFERYLIEKNYDIYLDEARLYPGYSFNRALEKAIDECAALIFLCTRHSNRSYYVEAEITYALNRRKTVITLQLTRATRPRLPLNAIETIRLFSEPLPQALQRLTNQMDIELSKYRSPSPPTPPTPTASLFVAPIENYLQFASKYGMRASITNLIRYLSDEGKITPTEEGRLLKMAHDYEEQISDSDK